MLYLASTSERRRALLSSAGFTFGLVEPGPEPVGRGSPLELARLRAKSKACGAHVVAGHGLVLGVDTVVDCDGEDLGKAESESGAREMLRRLSGRRHLVHTALCLVQYPGGGLSVTDATSIVCCRPLSVADLDAYVASGQWRGKAGSYGIQDPECGFMELVEGDLDTVVGLSIAGLRTLVEAVSPD